MPLTDYVHQQCNTYNCGVGYTNHDTTCYNGDTRECTKGYCCYQSAVIDLT